jgi:hypothetical protein
MRSRTTVLAVVAALLTLSVHAQTSRKRALLIGINDYSASRLKAERGTPGERDWPNLDGTINDVRLMGDLIQSLYGFKAADVITLTDQAATREAILGQLGRLVATAKKNDVVFFYYSGHGSQVRNSRSAEKDKLDESLVPADSRRGAADIRDKELRDRFNQLLDRGVRLTVVLDTCHSGSGARGLDGGLRARVVKPDLRDAADPSTGPRPENRGALILSATQDFDLAYETVDRDKVIRGAFTWALARALGDAEPNEPVSDTFLRAQAHLHVDRPGQDPVIAGVPEVRLRPFLGERIDRQNRRPVIAIQEIAPNGTYILQGGWANGVTAGSELRVAGHQDVRLEVKRVLGISSAEARLIPSTARADVRLAPGALLEIAAWAPPPARPLRVWIPRAGEPALRSAPELKEGAAKRCIQWIDDPTETTPTHLIRWRDGQWEVVAEDHVTRTATPLDVIGRGDSLFVQLPATAKLADALSTVEGVELTAGPDTADYILAGRNSGKGIEYAFIRPGVSARDAASAPLPLRTAWSREEASYILQDALTRLQRIHAWHDLRSPVGAETYYTLAIRRSDTRLLVADGVLLGEHPYHLVLLARPASRASVFTRYVYAFVIDSAGTSTLLFPRANSGSVENRLPLTTEAGRSIRSPAAEIPLDESEPFTIAAPYGADTYFLLSTSEPLPALASLEWTGVRGGKQTPGDGNAPKTPLERLLARTLSGTRGDPNDAPIRTPADWSIEKVTFQSVAPRRVQ